MKERSELVCAMSARAWGWLLIGVLGVAAGAVLAMEDGLHPAVPVLGLIIVGVGVLLLCCVLFTRRTRLVADADGFTFKNWRGSHSIPWHRLSSLQVKGEPAGPITTIVVVNDMGRSEMVVPVHLFDRRKLHDWLAALPARTPGLRRLLD